MLGPGRKRRAVEKLPGLADRDIPLPMLVPLLFITGTESHPELQEVIEEAGEADGLKIVPTISVGGSSGRST